MLLFATKSTQVIRPLNYRVDIGTFKLKFQKVVCNRVMLFDICRAYMGILEKQLEVSSLTTSYRVLLMHQVTIFGYWVKCCWCGIKYQIRKFKVLDTITGRNLNLGFTTSWINQNMPNQNSSQVLYPKYSISLFI